MTWEYEEKAWANGYGSVCGVDEAGRGPVAGPVCAAAVILPAGIVIEGLNDSKKLSEKKREKLFDEITENALAWSVSLVDERVIDEINILQATYRAMKQAVDAGATQGELPEGQEKVLWRIPVSRNSLARYYGRHLRI